MGETSIVHICLHFEPGCTALGEDLDRLNDRIIDLIDREFPHHSGMAMLVELGGRMSPLYFGGTDCPICGATIPQGEPCQICALRAQLAKKDREIAELRASLQDAQEEKEEIDFYRSEIRCVNGVKHPLVDGCIYCALAAARKALETIYLTLNQPGTPNRAFEDGIQDIARAALERINGDGHEGA